MDWLQWALLPLSGLLGGIIVDQRAKRNNSAVVQVSKMEAATSARNAASTEFAILTQGMTSEYKRLGARIKELEAQNERQAEDNRKMLKTMRQVMEYLEVVESLAPAELRPMRPTFEWGDDS